MASHTALAGQGALTSGLMAAQQMTATHAIIPKKNPTIVRLKLYMLLARLSYDAVNLFVAQLHSPASYLDVAHFAPLV